MKKNERAMMFFRRSGGTTIRQRAARVVLATAILTLYLGFAATGETAAGQELTLLVKHHSVMLKWKPSPTPNVMYNVYRSTVHGSGYKRLNSKPVRELKYTDKDVERGNTYYYVTRSMDGGGTESANSNEAAVTIP